MMRHWLGVGALVTAVTVPFACSTSHAVDVPQVSGAAVTLGLSGQSTMISRVVPLVGSRTTLVYARRDPRATVAAGGPSGFGSGTPARLFARSVTGAQVALGTVPAGCRRWSLAGDTLAVVCGREPDRAVRWWSVSTGSGGSLSVGAFETFLDAAPNGILTRRLTGEVVRRATSGTTTRLGRPFGRGSSTVINGIASEDGFVVTDRDSNEIRYQSWSQPHRFVDLDYGDNLPTHTLPVCSSLSTTDVTCIARVQHHPQVEHKRFRLPLNGSSPIASTLISATSPLPTGKVPAYGGLVLTEAGDHSRLYLRQHGELSQVVNRQAAAITVVAFRLVDGGIDWIDDALNRRDPKAVATVETQGLTVSPSSVIVGVPLHVTELDGGVSSGGPASLFVVAGSTLAVQGPRGVTISAPTGKREYAGHMVAADSRWLVTSDRDGRHRRLYDLSTGDALPLHDGLGTSHALSGDDLASLSVGGQLTVRNLSTGQITQVVAAHGDPTHGGLASVLIDGPWVAWTWASTPAVWHLQNWQTKAPATVLPHPVYTLTDSGVLMAVPRSASGRTGNVATPIWFRSYDAPVTTQLFAAQVWQQRPQVHDGMVAWIDAIGQLRAQRFTG